MSNANATALAPFIADAPETIEWPVVVTHPVDGGRMESFEFVGVFKRLSEDQINELLRIEPVKPAGDSSAGLASPAVPVKTDAELLRENAEVFAKILVGWKGPKDRDGADVPFSRERLVEVTTGANGKFFSNGVWRAVTEIRVGARLGNFEPSPGAGPS